jgi:hypothetical protein
LGTQEVLVWVRNTSGRPVFFPSSPEYLSYQFRIVHTQDEHVLSLACDFAKDYGDPAVIRSAGMVSEALSLGGPFALLQPVRYHEDLRSDTCADFKLRVRDLQDDGDLQHGDRLIALVKADFEYYVLGETRPRQMRVSHIAMIRVVEDGRAEPVEESPKGK